MPKRAPVFMRNALATRNSPDRWSKHGLRDGDKSLIEQALSEMLERKHNDVEAYKEITGVISRLRTLQ